MVQKNTKFWYLKDIFEELDDEELKLLDQYCKVRSIKKGETLYLQGSADKHVYVLKEGVVKITKTTPDGKEIILDIFGEGSLFGECPFAESHERDESAIVLKDGLMGIMKTEDIRNLAQKIPSLSIHITKWIGFRRMKIENKLIDLLFKTVEQRLATMLLNLIRDFGIIQDGGYLLNIKLTHKDFAALIASTRETVTVTFSKLKSQGLIDFDRNLLVVKSPVRLKNIAEGSMM